MRGVPQTRAIHPDGARCVHLRRLRAGRRTAPPGVDGDGPGTPGPPAEALAKWLRLRTMRASESGTLTDHGSFPVYTWTTQGEPLWAYARLPREVIGDPE